MAIIHSQPKNASLLLSQSINHPPNLSSLTFDDGLKHVWTVAFPLLKKYGLKATCFLITGCIAENDHRVRPTLEEYWKGEATLKDVLCMAPTEEALATWNEIKIMHESGVIDFQSHTMYHSLVFTSDKVFDFVHPAYNPYFYGNIFIPIYSVDGERCRVKGSSFGHAYLPGATENGREESAF